MPETKALTVFKYEANAPIGSSGTLKTLLEQSMSSLAQVLPRHITPEHLLKTALVAANRNPELLKCTQASIVESLYKAAELGLSVSGSLGEGFIIPFNNKVTNKSTGKETWIIQAQFVPGYPGLTKLARQSGEVKRIEAEVVYSNDKFLYKKGKTPVLDFEPLLTGDRGKMLGAYALAELSDGDIQTDWMTVEDIEKVRQRSKAKNGPAWSFSFGEMSRKTVFRRLAKWLPLSSEKFSKAIELSDQEFDINALSSGLQLTPGESRSENLANRLAGSISVESKVLTDEPEVVDNAEVIDASQTAEDRYLTVTELADLVKQMAALKVKLPSLIAGISDITGIPESEITTDSSTWKILKSQATLIINSF